MRRNSEPDPSLKFIKGIISQTLLNSIPSQNSSSFISLQNPTIRPALSADMVPFVLLHSTINDNSLSQDEFDHAIEQQSLMKSNTNIDSYNSQSKLSHAASDIFSSPMSDMKEGSIMSRSAIIEAKEVKDNSQVDMNNIRRSDQPRVAIPRRSHSNGFILSTLGHFPNQDKTGGIQPKKNTYLEIALNNEPKSKVNTTAEQNANIAIHIGLIEVKAINSLKPSLSTEIGNQQNKQFKSMSLSDYLTKRSKGRY